MKVLKSLKRFAGMAVIAFALTSCFDFTSTESYTLVADFEYGTDLVTRPDSTYYPEQGYGVPYNYLVFCHNVETTTYEFLCGFRVSTLQGVNNPEADKTLNMTWRANTEPRANTYMVNYLSSQRPTHDIEFMAASSGTCTMRMCQVTNTVKVAQEIASTFQRGDKLTLVATGYKGGQVTGTAEINLADYTQNDKSGQPKDSIVSTWTSFNLASLQQVDKVSFALVSTKSVQQYFCLDNVVADIYFEY